MTKRAGKRLLEAAKDVTVPRDPHYGKPIRWDRLYNRHCPHRTDPVSRHVALIAQSLRDVRSPMRRLLDGAGYEPDHMAESLEITVKCLWEAREDIEKLGDDPFKRVRKPKDTA